MAKAIIKLKIDIYEEKTIELNVSDEIHYDLQVRDAVLDFLGDIDLSFNDVEIEEVYEPDFTDEDQELHYFSNDPSQLSLFSN